MYIKLNSVIVHINFAKTWRGGERQVVLLYHELQKMGLNQKLICRRGSALHRYSIEHGFEYVTFSTVTAFLFAPIYLSFFRLKEPLIVHCHESKAQTIAVLANLFSGKKIKTIVHRRVLFPIKKKFTTPIKYSEKLIDKMICISKAVESKVKNSIGFSSTVVIPSCVSVDLVEEDVFDLRGAFNIGSEEKIVAYIAALTFEKDHSTFFKAAADIIRQIDRVQFLVVGDGPLRKDLENEVAALNLKDSVTFTGFIYQPERVIPQVDVLLFTSRSEGLGSTILDFFVYQKPVVSVRNGGAEEIIEDGKTGLLCSVGDYERLAGNVVRLMKEPVLVKNLTEAAYDYVLKCHTPSAIALKTVDVYRSVEDIS